MTLDYTPRTKYQTSTFIFDVLKETYSVIAVNQLSFYSAGQTFCMWRAANQDKAGLKNWGNSSLADSRRLEPWPKASMKQES